MTRDDEIRWIKLQIDANKNMRECQALGEAYYEQENTAIMQRKKQYYSAEGNLVDDGYVSNYKLTSGYMTTVVDQKVSYSINGSMVATSGSKDVDDILDSNWRDDMAEVSTSASVKGFGVWQFYLDESGATQYKEIPPEQITVCKDGDDAITHVIRQYNRTNDQMKAVTVVELWSCDSVTKYEYETNEDWICTCDNQPHLVDTTVFGSVVADEEGRGWGRPPFAVLYNNKKCRTDLQPIKGEIDAFDFVKSDYANNLEDFQEMYWLIKNYDGSNLKELKDDIKLHQAVKVSDDGEIDMQTREIPHEAKLAFLEMINKCIYKDSMAVDMSDMEGTVTTVEIRSMYTNLDMKATKFERSTTRFIKDAMFFYNESDEVSIEYDRNILINFVEMATLANNSKGSISEETRLGSDPRVNNTTDEIAAMRLEKGSQIDELTI